MATAPNMACPFPGQAGPSSTSSALDQGKVQVNWLVDWLGGTLQGLLIRTYGGSHGSFPSRL